MARWRQVILEDGSSKMVPLDEAAAKIDGVEFNPEARHQRHFIHGDIERFVSVVDGSIIDDRGKLEEHNRRNNVVNSAEFSPEYYEQKQKERFRERTTAEKWRDRAQIYETINELNAR